MKSIMKKWLKIVITLVGIIILNSCLIRLSYAADLLQVYHQALKNDQTFQSARATYLAETEAYPQAIALLLPDIYASGSIMTTHVRNFGRAAELASTENFNGYIYSLNINEAVINFANWWGVHTASYQVKEAAATYAAAAQDLLLRTATAYFNVLLAEDNLRFSIAQKNANRRQLDQAKQRLQVGLDAVTSVYNAQASYDATAAQVIANRNNVDNTKEQLRQITGVYYKHLATLKRRMPLLTPNPKNIQAWLTKANHLNFQIQAAIFAMEAARQNIKVEFAGHLPTVSIVASSTKTHNGSILDGGTGRFLTNVAGIQANIPLFQGGLVSSQVRQAQFDYQNAVAQMENTHLQVSANLRQTYNSIIAGISKIKADQQAVFSQAAALKSTEAALSVGTRTMVDLLNAQQQLFQAQSQLAQDQYTYINNTLLFKDLAGTLTYKDIVAINTWLQGKCMIQSPYKNVVEPQKLLITHKSAQPKFLYQSEIPSI